MLRKQEQLIANRGLGDPMNIEAIQNDNQIFLSDLENQSLNNLGIVHLPENPPFEIHPYKDTLQLQNFNKYIIGTFPPISYVYDIIPTIQRLNQPQIGNGRRIPRPGFPFFHGNRQLMWDYLLSPDEIIELPNDRQLVRNYLIDKLNQMSINYGDIIDSMQRNLYENRYKGSDNLLKNISFNKELICHIFSNKSARYLLFNTASIYGLSGIEFDNNGFINIDSDAKAFDLFVRILQEHGYLIELRISIGVNVQFPWTPIIDLTDSEKSTKIAFEMKIINPNGNSLNLCNNFELGSERDFIVITPFSPAVAQRVNLLAGNPIVANYLAINQGQDTKQMLFLVYQDFRNSNWEDLFNYNQ